MFAFYTRTQWQIGEVIGFSPWYAISEKTDGSIDEVTTWTVKDDNEFLQVNLKDPLPIPSPIKGNYVC